MACGEFGPGRMAAPDAIIGAIGKALGQMPDGGPLTGKHALVTSGPTHEPIDPVRYIANRSSGTQGSAIAARAAELGAQVTFVTGPATAPRPAGVDSDRGGDRARDAWRRSRRRCPPTCRSLRRGGGLAGGERDRPQDEEDCRRLAPALDFAENPDILSKTGLSHGGRAARARRGFRRRDARRCAANATAKRARKGCDWIVANDVSPATGIMGGASG